jgi:hypothetical protein
MGYFPVESKGGESASASQPHTMDGIAVGRCEKSNTITFYNPLTRSYYNPPVFKLDESTLPAMIYPKSIRYDGGFVCGLLRNQTDPSPEPFPPGTRVNVKHNNILVRGTVQNVPMPISPLITNNSVTNQNDESNPSPHTNYVIHLDSNETIEVSFEDLLSPDEPNTDVSPSQLDAFSGLPETKFQFVVKRNLRSSKIDFTVPLPDFKQSWTTLVGENILIPGHTTVSSFLRPNSSNNAPSANLVSAKNLLNPCPPSLLKALHPSNPDRDTWLKSYNEEKGGLQRLEVFDKISKKQYLALRRSGKIGKALPSMCVLVIKNDKDGNPCRAKSRIVVLGNYEDRYYSKSQKYAPVLKYSSLRLLTSKAVEHKRILQQGDCNNAFCHAKLPPDEQCAVRPPPGDPGYSKDEYWLLNKTLYGLRRSPHHWYNMFTKALRDMGLQQSVHDPCLFAGASLPPNLNSPLIPTRAEVFVGIYVDDFVFYSTDPGNATQTATYLSTYLNLPSLTSLRIDLVSVNTTKLQT